MVEKRKLTFFSDGLKRSEAKHNVGNKRQKEARVKYKRTWLKVLFVYNRYRVKVDHSNYIVFIRIETAKSLKVIDTTDKIQMFSTLSCDVSYSTREALIGQVKDKFKEKSHVHHSHLCTRIVISIHRRSSYLFQVWQQRRIW